MAVVSALDAWVHAVLAELRPEQRADGSQVELALLRDDSARFDRFRRNVLFRVLTGSFRQRVREVSVLLDQYFDGGLAAWEPEAAEDGSEDLTLTDLTDGLVPVEELVQHAWNVLEDRARWQALGQEHPDHATTWLARLVAWRTHDALRRTTRTEDGAAPPPRAHHRVAGWLDQIAEADPDLDGPEACRSARGAYGAVLEAVAARLARTPEPDDRVHYVLRKLFPWHAWPASADARAQVGRPLVEDLAARWGAHAAWEAVSAGLSQVLGGAPVGTSVPDGLATSARVHISWDDFPDWNEAGLWTGALPASLTADQRMRKVNTLQKRIGRLNLDIEDLVSQARDRVAASCRETG